MDDARIIDDFLIEHNFAPSAQLRSKFRTIRINKGQAVLQKGMDIHCVYIVIEGTFEVEHPAISGGIYNFTRIQSGNLLGELEMILGNEKSKFTVRCTSGSSVLLVLERNIFLDWIHSDIHFSSFIIDLLAQKVIINAETVAYFPFTSGEDKVIFLLVNYCKDSIAKGFTFPVSVNLSRENMGNRIGVCVKTVNRSITSLKSRSLVSVNKKVLTISETQYDELKRLANAKRM